MNAMIYRNYTYLLTQVGYTIAMTQFCHEKVPMNAVEGLSVCDLRRGLFKLVLNEYCIVLCYCLLNVYCALVCSRRPLRVL